MAEDPWFVLRETIGSRGATGASPDIILGGQKPDPKYTSDYDKAFGRTGNFTGSNFVYVRAKNTGSDLAVGSVAVYAVQLTELPNRGLWNELHTRDGRATTNIGGVAGAVAVNGAPLIWEPNGPPPDAAPWCLVAEITGDNYPSIKVPAKVTDKVGFDEWISTQERIAYVVVEKPHVVPSVAPSFGWQRMVDLANADPVTLEASLTCTSGAGGFLSYSFDKPDSSGRPIGVGKTRYQLNNVYSQSRTVAAGYSSNVSITYTPEGDVDGEAEFVFQLATETGGDGDGDLGTSQRTVIANYRLQFGQVRSAK